MTGSGVSNDMMSGYRFLAERYEPVDEIFIVGFSRGAYTARCLAGDCHDTYAKFLGGTYAHRNARHYRPIREGVAGQVVDESVYERPEADPTCRPQNPGLRPL